MKKLTLYDSVKDTRYCVPNLDKVIVGRSRTCDVYISQEISTLTISRHHCIIQRFPDGEIYICDNKSRFGTYLNESQLDAKKNEEGTAESKDCWKLKNGDKLRLGDYALEVIVEEEMPISPGW